MQAMRKDEGQPWQRLCAHSLTTPTPILKGKVLEDIEHLTSRADASLASKNDAEELYDQVGMLTMFRQPRTETRPRAL